MRALWPVPAKLIAAGVALALAGSAHAQTEPDSRVYSPPPGSPDTSIVLPASPDSSAAPLAAPVDSSGLQTAPTQPPVPPIDLPFTTPGEGPGQRVGAVRAAGFSQVDSIVVIRTFGLRAGDAYSREAVREGVRRLYQSGLYTDVNVTDAPDAGGVALTVTVTERPRVHAVKFEGGGKIDDTTLKGKLTLAEGQLLDQGTLALDEAKIAEAYAEEGYARAKISSKVAPFGPGTIDVVFSIDPGEKVKVRDIVIHQLQPFPGLYANDLKDAMKSETPGFLKSGVYKPSYLEEDHTQLRLHMRSRGYKDADVDSIRPEFLPDGKSARLHVYIRPGERYRFGSVQWSGNASVGTEALQAVTAVVPNAPYSEPQIHKTLEGAYTLYQELGYLYLSIEPQFAEHGSVVDVIFTIQEGTRSRIADLQIVGNTRTKENVIRREALVRPGDVFRRSTLIRTQRDIFALGFFQDVQVDYAPTGDSADINLTLRVQEKQTGTASAGAGFASSTGLTGFLELGHNNLFGNGQSINLH
ncbi:MAG TPA: outer membrane protein assembly factor BamA, partial [Candidatus Eisenbacteria bacterium]|nr:outer membrane protein assembly factor BamA [Candidatus Eisenbacteria bacterium]